MEPQKIAQQMINLYKAGFDNTFNAMVMLQEQMERMTARTWEQTTWLPEEGKKVFTEWVKAYKKGGENFKKTVDENFKTLEGFLAEPDKTKTAKTTPTA